MATVAKTTVSPDTGELMKAPQTPLIADDTIAAGDMVYIDSTGGVTRCIASSSGAVFDGVCFDNAVAGQPVTIHRAGTRLQYGAGLTPGALLYLHVSIAGALQTTTSTGDAIGVAKCMSDTDIMITRLC